MTNINDIFTARDSLYLDMVKFLTRLRDNGVDTLLTDWQEIDQMLEEDKRIEGMMNETD